MNLRGTHGTSRTYADAILAGNWFKPTVAKKSRAGKGVYFWASHEDDAEEIVTKYLAVSWFMVHRRSGIYGKDSDNCAVIGVDISQPSELEYFDATPHKFQNELQLMALTAGAKNFDTGSATSVLIKKLEAIRKSTIILLKTTVQTPKRPGTQCPIAKSFPNSNVYVVRDGGQKLLCNPKIIHEEKSEVKEGEAP
ncbi:hypothetical protein [Delftia acidovorans]|uniref:Uncharacterized protein n=1 Tax=Delftia acidovorans TaxID=80866 RepID=A0AAJ2VEH4_DELAC|nr:hypothetical protein [Delftia acidovorans]MDX4955872.1 hypothetical protein [Delftia acidovorans]